MSTTFPASIDSFLNPTSTQELTGHANLHVNLSDSIVALETFGVTLTGTQTLTNKTLTTPTISSFTNANHDHTNSANGGVLTAEAIESALSYVAADAADVAALGTSVNTISVSATTVNTVDLNITGDVTGLVKGDVGLGSVDNTTDANKPVSTATQTALDLKAPLYNPTFTGTVILPSGTSIASVSGTEISYLDGVTSSIQTQINSKAASSDIAELAQDAIGGIVGSGLLYSDSTPSLTLDSTVVQLRVSGITDTEIEYLDGVTSAIQTQIDAKSPIASPTFTGTVILPSGTSITSPTINGGINSKSIALSPIERMSIVALESTGTINLDVNTAGTLYYTSNASADWTLNIRGNNSTTLNSIMTTGDSITVTFLSTQGSSAYKHSVLKIDGSSITPKWLSASTPTGNPSSIDAYSFTIIKTGSAAFTVLASQAQFG